MSSEVQRPPTRLYEVRTDHGEAYWAEGDVIEQGDGWFTLWADELTIALRVPEADIRAVRQVSGGELEAQVEADTSDYRRTTADGSSHRCPRCDCPDNAPQCEHCKACLHAVDAPHLCQQVHRVPHDAHDGCPGWMPDDDTGPEEPLPATPLEEAQATIESLRYQIRRAREALAGDEPGTNRRDKDAELRYANEQMERLTAERDEARAWARHGYEIGQRHCGWTDHGVAPEWLTEGWPSHFDDCEHLRRASELDAQLAAIKDSINKESEA